MSSQNTMVTWKTPAAGGAVVDVLQSSPDLLQSLTNEGKSKDARRPHSTLRNVLIFFPGNPGLVHWYEPLCAYLAENRFDVLVMGYAGQSFTELNGGRVFALPEQIDIADSFVAAVVNKNTEVRYNGNVYVAGHSIGGFVALQMVARYPSIKKCFGLCPVLSNFRETPNGRRLSFLGSSFAQWVLAMFAALLGLVPYSLRLFLITRSTPKLPPSLAKTLARHFNHRALANSLFMGGSEYHMLLQPDVSLLRRVQERLVLYFVKDDGWVPLSFVDTLKAICPRLGLSIIEEDPSISHTWCLDQSEKVARNAILSQC